MNAATPATPDSGANALGALGLPRSVGGYTLFELIGKGGMAQIYLARAETALGATRLAVVKQILPAFADDPRFAEMLIHEAKLAAGLSHRHIVQVFDLGRAGDALFIAMEYVEGFDLNALLRQCTENSVGLPAEHALGIVADVLEGLDYAHRLGIVHRDVSPSNLLISYDGEVKLCDFGIAHANDVVRPSEHEALKGKAGYMSPEHARGEALDARADVFAAGIILWELLAGKRLYRPRSEVPLVDQAKAAVIPPLPDKGLPRHAELEAIVRRALAKERSERYPSASAFQRDLDAYLAETSMLASRLKLGAWMAKTFGTKLLEERRASERKLPKSAPPPRSSERVRAGTAAASSARIPSAPSLPRDLLASTERDGEHRDHEREIEHDHAHDHERDPAGDHERDCDRDRERDADGERDGARSRERGAPAPRAHEIALRSEGAMRAFQRDLGESPLAALRVAQAEGGMPGAPGSLAAIDVSPPSRTSMTPAASGPRSSPARTLALLVLAAIALGVGFVALARVLVH